MSRTRRRNVPGYLSESGNWFYDKFQDPVTNNGSNARLVSHSDPATGPTFGSVQGQQLTVDTNHGFHLYPQYLTGARLGDIGGDFWSQKKWWGIDSPHSHYFDKTGFSAGTWIHERYRGPILAMAPNSVFPSYSETNLGPKGTTAIARCKPTNNVANLAVDIAEIFRDGLPHLLGGSQWKNRTSTAKAAGGEYLNYTFGWAPLVGDMRGAAYAVANAHRLLEAYERNSGKLVRRRYEFDIERTQSETNLGPADGSPMASFAQNINWNLTLTRPNLYRLDKFYRRTWFSGAFTYHLPTGYKSRNWLVETFAKAGPLLGIELTPDIVWEAAPWSWAANWFSNMGDVSENLSDWSVDGLVLRHGYVMEHTLQSSTYYLDGPTRFVLPSGSRAFASPVTSYVETKRRVRATPFGFGVTWNTMTPRQLAIAAALGITRVF